MLTQGHNAAHRSLERPLMNDWPYPTWIAHRGAGTLAPENTLAAFRLGASHGYRMFECDVKLSSDGIPFLLHDDTLERTTAATPAGEAEPVAGRHPVAGRRQGAERRQVADRQAAPVAPQGRRG